MKIKMKQMMAGPNLSRQIGQVLDSKSGEISAADAQHLIDVGYAELVKEKPKQSILKKAANKATTI